MFDGLNIHKSNLKEKKNFIKIILLRKIFRKQRFGQNTFDPVVLSKWGYLYNKS